MKRLKPFEFQNWIIKHIHGDHSPRRTGDMGIDGYWFLTKDPVQVKQSESVGRNVVDNFETAIRREGRTTGYIIAFSFTRGAVEETVRARKDGLDVKLIKVAEVLMSIKRPGVSKQYGPQPETEEEQEAAIFKLRKPEEMPRAEELIESDREAAG